MIKPRSNLYRLGKTRRRKDGTYENLELENNCLYAKGIYPTKLTVNDLPESYISVYSCRDFAYVNAAGVKDMVYFPCYISDNHLFKDDSLYVSYDEPIDRTKKGWQLYSYNGKIISIAGRSIEKFAKAASKYSGFDSSEILNEIDKKKRWYVQTNPEHRALGNEEMYFETRVYYFLHTDETEDEEYEHHRQEETLNAFCQKWNLTLADKFCSNSTHSLSKTIEEILQRKENGEDIQTILFTSRFKNSKDVEFEKAISHSFPFPWPPGEGITLQDVYMDD